jgi:8-oxo-dGTP diphosphatase
MVESDMGDEVKPPVVAVVGAAIRRHDQVLVALRGREMSHAGHWEFPGGKVEEGEEPDESLCRELREELGVSVEVGEYVGRGVVEEAHRTIVLDVYWCELLAGDPYPHEHETIAWLSASELEELQWAEADVPIVAAVTSGLRHR